jgi:hypothetical protein
VNDRVGVNKPMPPAINFPRQECRAEFKLFYFAQKQVAVELDRMKITAPE